LDLHKALLSNVSKTDMKALIQVLESVRSGISD
jgi:hypothetical protein